MSGILGLNLSGDVFLEDIASAAGIMQPRGDEWGGIAVRRNGTIDRFASQGKITPLFAREHEQLSGARQFIVHVNQSPKNPQPAWIEETDMGPIALAFDGKINNKQEIRKRSPYLIGSEAGIMARLVGAASTPLEGIESVFNTIQGPFCLVLLTKDGIYAARDTLGIRPLTWPGRWVRTPGAALLQSPSALNTSGWNSSGMSGPEKSLRFNLKGSG
jgi:amidophosphoribosyltransferase